MKIDKIIENVKSVSTRNVTREANTTELEFM